MPVLHTSTGSVARRTSIASRFLGVLALAVVPVATAALLLQWRGAAAVNAAARQQEAAQRVAMLAQRSMVALLVQDDAAKGMLLDHEHMADQAQRKIEAYDLAVALADSMLALSPSPSLRTLIAKLHAVDSTQLRPLDTKVLELMSENPRRATAVYQDEYVPARDVYASLVTELGTVAGAEAAIAAGVVRSASRTAFLLSAAALLGTAALLSSVLVWLLTGVTRRLEQGVRAVESVAAGDLRSVPETGTMDEVGRMAEAVGRAVIGIRTALGVTQVDWTALGHQRVEAEEARAREAERAARERAEAAELRARVDALLGTLEAASHGDLTVHVTVSGDDAVGRMGDAFERLLGVFRASINGIVRNADLLAMSADQLADVGSELHSSAGDTSHQAGALASASSQVSQGLQTVSAGTEEMNASITEIARTSADAARVVNEGVQAAQSTNEAVERLGESSSRIGQVVKVIHSIAQQTNLLALNATIEAARAGEMGKGFAVVAQEVKELAKQTANATDDITQRVTAIQTDTDNAVAAISRITEVIGRINDFQLAIASAMEEQSAVTAEMRRTLAESAVGGAAIAEGSEGVNQASARTLGAAKMSQEAANSLARMAEELKVLVSRFRTEEPPSVLALAGRPLRLEAAAR